MLTAILEEFQRTRKTLCADEVAQRLAHDAAAIEGMLGLLVQMGMLVEIGGRAGCDLCPAHSSCWLFDSTRKAYGLPQIESGSPLRSG